MRDYLVSLTLLYTTIIITTTAAAGAETLCGRVLDITRTPESGITLHLEVPRLNNREVHAIMVHSSTLPADVQLNSHLQVEIAPESSGNKATNAPSATILEAKAIKLIAGGGHGFGSRADKTGVRARMMRAGHNSSRLRGSGRRGH